MPTKNLVKFVRKMIKFNFSENLQIKFGFNANCFLTAGKSVLSYLFYIHWMQGLSPFSEQFELSKLRQCFKALKTQGMPDF